MTGLQVLVAELITWNLTNPGDADPVYEKVGPFEYDITYHERNSII